VAANLRNRVGWAVASANAGSDFGRALAAGVAARHLRRVAPTLGLASRDEALGRDKAVVLFVDTFNGNFETENAVAAVRVLQAAATRCTCARGDGGELCCGRTCSPPAWPTRRRPGAAAARRLAAVRRARHRHRRPRAVVPADAARRDAGHGPGRTRATVGGQALLFEEFVVREARAGRFAPALQPAARPIPGARPLPPEGVRHRAKVLEALRLIPGAEPTLIESSCCGMAGTFGYEAEH
jgi:hypothetical protein